MVYDIVEFHAVAQERLQTVQDLIDLMPDRGDKQENSQKVTLQVALNNLEACFNGVEPEDIEDEIPEGQYLVGVDFMNCIQIDDINNLDLRSDLENNNIYTCLLVPQGYAGNRPHDFEGEEHEDDTWAIDVLTLDGFTVTNYLYSSEYEYDQDVETINCV